jgi:hypothetical protein
MARKTNIIKIDDTASRDNGKSFVITEMSAFAAEMWAFRALAALAKSGIDIPDNIASAGIMGIASYGMKALTNLPFTEAKSLLDDILACVQIIPDPKTPWVFRKIFDGDIEEVRTLFMLRKEVWNLHVGFSIADGN